MDFPNSFFKHDAQAGGFYPKSHVGIDVTDFGHYQNLLIEGIRGSGKTHILKMVEQDCILNYKKNKIFPVYVSLAQINEHVRAEPEDFRLHLYTHIVQRCVETVETYKESLQPDTGLLAKAIDNIKKLFNLNTNPSFDDLISEIKNVSENLRFQLTYNLSSKSFKDTNGIVDTKSDSVKGKAGAKVKGAEANFEAEHKSGTTASKQLEENTMYVGSKLAHRNASGFLLEFLKQIQIILNLEHSLILLDECSEADFQAQVEIFRLFKSIRGCNSLLSDKQSCVHFIGSVYPQGGTYYPTRDKDGFNFEPGHDCSIEFMEWDELDQQTYLNFYKDMFLYRTMAVIGYEGDFNDLVKEVFESYDGFLLAAFCSNGLPRRFWEILRRGYDKGTSKFLTKGLEIAVQEIANDQILGAGNLTAEDVNFINILVDRLKDKNIDIRTHNNKHGLSLPQYIYFSINRQYRFLIDKLIVQGAVHDKSRMRMKSKFTLKPIFSIDIALVYNFNIITQSNLVKTMMHDIPRCANNGFDQAIDVKNNLIIGVYNNTYISDDNTTKRQNKVQRNKSKIESKPVINDSGDTITNIREKDVVIERASLTGTVKIIKALYGFIIVDDGGEDAIFYKAKLDQLLKKTLKPLDRVSFDLMITEKGRRADNLELYTDKV
jgi:cold shock CspA family protein